MHHHTSFYIQYRLLSDVLAPFFLKKKKVSLILVGESFKIGRFVRISFVSILDVN